MSDPSTLAKRLEDSDPETRRLAIQELGEVPGQDPKEALALLARGLGDEDWRVRKEAARIAPFLSDHDALVVSLVLLLENKENVGLRNAAVEALIAIGSDAIPATIGALRKLDADGRKLAVEILGGIPDSRGVLALVKAVKDPDPNVRATAAEALGKAGFAGEEERALATKALVASLETGDELLILAALEALGRLDAKVPWRVFEPFAKHVLLRRYAVIAAARSREEAALLALIQATGDASATTAREALLALGAWILFEPLEDDVLGRARRRMREVPGASAFVRSVAKDPGEARGHAAALVVLGLLQEEEDVATLVEAIADEEVTEHAAAGLELFGAAAAGPLSRLLPHASQHTRAVILSLLPLIEPEPNPDLRATIRGGMHDAATEVALASLKNIAASGDESDLGRLIPLTNSIDDRVALAAASALHVLTERYPEAARQLLGALDPNGDHVVAGCAMAGALRHAPLTSDLGFLQRALRHGEARARRVAVDALARMACAARSPSGQSPADMVAFALADEEREVRLAAVRALGQLGQADPLVAFLTSATDNELIASVLRALGEADEERGFEAARTLVRSVEPAVACAAIESLGRYGVGSDGALGDAAARAKREDGLFEGLDHADPEVVKLTITELARSSTPRSIARIGHCLEHESPEVRRLASELLGQEKSPAAQALLRARLEREKEHVVRDALTLALSLRPPPSIEGG